MPIWRVQYETPDEIFCTSVHQDEEIARMDTARHLMAMMTLLRKRTFFKHYRYGKDFPEAMEDAEATAQRIEALIFDGKEWAAYDAWHEYLARWPEVFGMPVWIGVGTVIVEGPGPSVQVPFHTARRGGRQGPASGELSGAEPTPFEEGLSRLMKHPFFVRLVKQTQQLRAAGDEARADEVWNRHIEGAIRRMAEDPEFQRVTQEAEKLKETGNEAEADALRDAYWGQFMQTIMPTGERRFRRWKVTAGKPSEGVHASFHMQEEDARAQVDRELRQIIEGARFVLDIFGRGAIHHLDYWREVRDAAMETVERLDAGDTWGAYDRWRQFEDYDEEAGRADGGQVGPPPMMPHVGTLRVEVD